MLMENVSIMRLFKAILFIILISLLSIELIGATDLDLANVALKQPGIINAIIHTDDNSYMVAIQPSITSS